VSILATSREPLGVPGEKVWYLPSLTLPENGGAPKLANIAQSEAVRLFIERTADIQPGYQPSEAESQAIAQICLSLDGIPLAIELAAARMSLLSAREIAARLDSRFQLLTAGYRTMLPRHQTLQAAIEWSYELLSQAEQTLLRRLSVFAGSFTLEAAETVCAGEGIQREQVLTLLGRLVDKSLLQAGLHLDPGSQDADLATRFRLLDTICSFGHMKLEEAGEVELIRNRHADYYVFLVETAEPELLLSRQGRWYRLLRVEQDNLRSVVEWSVESGHAESALRLMGALTWSWWSHGSVHEGLDLALKALTLPAGEFERHYARALNTAAWLQWVMGDISAAREKVEEALSILRKLNDKASLSWALQFLGMVLTSEGQYEPADVVMQEAVAIAQKTGDLSKSNLLAFLGDISMQKGDHSKAMSIYQESAHVLSTWGNKLFEAYPLRRLGYLALERGEFEPAGDYFWRSLKFNQEGDDRGGTAACLIGFAVLALHLDMPVIAARLLGAAECQIETFTINLLYLDQVELKLLQGRLKAALDEDNFRTAFEKGWQMSEEQVMELVDLLTGDRC
jgi:predicted ATPase